MSRGIITRKLQGGASDAPPPTEIGLNIHHGLFRDHFMNSIVIDCIHLSLGPFSIQKIKPVQVTK